jgi:REP element-mobilizing transposase RayT
MSYTSLHTHIVFATKNRQKIISTAWRARLHEYLGGTAKGLEAFPQGIGGIDDHVHLLIGFKATHRLSEFMQELKKSASVWVHEEIGLKEFAWQEGYAAFSVSPTARPTVKSYIANQEEHHRRKTFTEELIELLDAAGIVYDPKFLE